MYVHIRSKTCAQTNDTSCVFANVHLAFVCHPFGLFGSLLIVFITIEVGSALQSLVQFSSALVVSQQMGIA